MYCNSMCIYDASVFIHTLTVYNTVPTLSFLNKFMTSNMESVQCKKLNIVLECSSI